MLAKRIIPCLDVDKGRVVKGTSFLHLRDAGNPVEVSKLYNSEGADELVFLDISASHEGRKTTLDMVERVASKVSIPFTVGGGIRHIDDIRDLLHSGCDKVSINTAAVEDENLIRKSSHKFGSQCIVVAIDCKYENTNFWRVYSHAGRRQTPFNAINWANRAEFLGAGEILLTSIDRDGTNKGYDIKLTRMISDTLKIPVIASGGAGKPEDFIRILAEGKADAALAASIFHFGIFRISEIKKYLYARGVSVRL